ncbi:MAG: RCC1 repeat-containing protein [Pseudomonadota bacterium]
MKSLYCGSGLLFVLSVLGAGCNGDGDGDRDVIDAIDVDMTGDEVTVEDVEDGEGEPVGDPVEEDTAAEDTAAEDTAREEAAEEDALEEDVEGEPEPVCGNGEREGDEECDDGADGDQGDGCTDDCEYSCHENEDCGDGFACTDDVCDEYRHRCVNDLTDADTVCRPIAGECDVAEACDGETEVCPIDVYVAETGLCRESIGECDIEERCTGTGPLCPDDGFVVEGTPCDLDDYCTDHACDATGHCWGDSIDDLHGVMDASAGTFHTCALLGTGAVKCWGRGEDGRLGNGATLDSAVPVDVTGLGAGVVALASGADHTCALLATGGVQCWGDGANGKLGNGANEDSSVPVDVSGLASGVGSISARGSHTCALMEGGGVKCWGRNHRGQLGNGTTTDSNTPVDVTGLTEGAAAVAAGGNHTCAFLMAGGLTCWGENDHGQLGDGTNDNSPVPAAVSGLSTEGSAIAAGNAFTCVEDEEGVHCWGENWAGQLGDGTTLDSSVPVDVAGLSADVWMLSAGARHVCALLETGGVVCWGQNIWGGLGNGSAATSGAPVDVLGLDAGVSVVTAGWHHTCAVLGDGAMLSWGWDDTGQLGDGRAARESAAVDVTGFSSTTTAVDGGMGMTCALLDTGGVQCQGGNAHGELGDGTLLGTAAGPVDVSGMTSAVASLTTGEYHACAVSIGGGLKCWGNNAEGQLGDGTNDDQGEPVDVTGLTSGVSAAAAGESHTCALTDAGGVTCWGRGAEGQLGNGAEAESAVPVDVTGVSGGVVAIAVGGWHSCALFESGGVQCWGRNSSGQLGNGTTDNSSTPVDVTGLTDAAAVAAGGSHTCALLDGGGVKCWGGGSLGQLGDGGTSNRSTPVDVSGLSSGVSAIIAGLLHTCALLDAGGVKCWGDGEYGQPGDGTYEDKTAPVDVTGLASGVSAIGAGNTWTCAILEGGGMKCWGGNHSGQITGVFQGYPHAVACN